MKKEAGVKWRSWRGHTWSSIQVFGVTTALQTPWFVLLASRAMREWISVVLSPGLWQFVTGNCYTTTLLFLYPLCIFPSNWITHLRVSQMAGVWLYFSLYFPQHSALTWRHLWYISCNKSIDTWLIISFNLKSLHNKLEIYNKHRRSVNEEVNNDTLFTSHYCSCLAIDPILPLSSNSRSIIWVNSYSLETVGIFSQPI